MNILKSVLPEFLYNGLKVIYKGLKPILKSLHTFYFIIKLKKVQANHKKALEIVRKKEKICVAFFAIFDSVWKYDDLYNLMLMHPRFDPIIFVCPVINEGHDNMVFQMEKTYLFFLDKSYNVIKTYNQERNEFLDIKKIYNPDIVFYTNPYKGLQHRLYYISKFKNKLTCYVPYAIMTTKRNAFYNLPFHNFVWKIFCETNLHVKLGSELQRRKGENYVCTGYPGLDRLFKGVVKKNPWKENGSSIKKIIWAPHHLINCLDKRSNFLEYNEIFLQIANKYSGKLQIAFKPHPLLKQVLYKLSDWGIKRTDEYYKKWENLSNGQYEDGEYIDLFLTSDALIHDCGSFLSEYLSTGKPCLFMKNKNFVNSDWSEYGLKTLEVHYNSQNVAQLILFIENVVINDDDWMKEKRVKFVETNLKPPFNKSASENIYDYLVNNFF